jgi:hypothetical protein
MRVDPWTRISAAHGGGSIARIPRIAAEIAVVRRSPFCRCFLFVEIRWMGSFGGHVCGVCVGRLTASEGLDKDAAVVAVGDVLARRLLVVVGGCHGRLPAMVLR